MAGSSVLLPPWKRVKDTIDPGSTKSLFTRSLSTFRTIRAIVSVANSTEDKARQFDMVIINSGGELKDSISYRVGSTPSINIAAEKVGSNLEIKITNNESYTIGVNLIHATFSAAI